MCVKLYKKKYVCNKHYYSFFKWISARIAKLNALEKVNDNSQ